MEGSVMGKNNSVTVKDLVDRFQLEVSYKGTDYETHALTVTDVNRPGLQFVGFFDYFDPERLQIIGKAEVEYLHGFTPEERRKRFSDLFSYEIPAFIISRNLDIFPECMEMAKHYGRTLLRTKLTAVEFTSLAIDYLNHELAPMITRHGVLLDVYGEGVIIMGDSGIGKSETAIELIKRGHRLVADDAVEIRRIGNSLIGSAPELIRDYLEVRGVGVIDIQKIFGMGAVQESTQIDLIIKFEEWTDGYVYDRLGLDDDYMQILDVSVPCVTIPVRAGRNLAGIAEIAAMNNRQKKYGFNSAQMFVEKIDRQVDKNSK
jgi:HPr kinase/phosphorylase